MNRAPNGWPLKTLLRILSAAGRIALLSSIGLLIYVRFFEHRLIYYPRSELPEVPSVPFDDVSFPAADGTRLHGWFLPGVSERVLIVSHGNGGNIGYRRSMAEFLIEEFPVNVFMYDYRGYGRSEGSPSEEGTYADIRGAYDWTRERGYAPGEIYLLGQSLGSAIAIDLASKVEVGGVIIEAGLASIAAMARHQFKVPLGWLMRTRYDALSKVGSIDAPIAFVHARGDGIVPFAQGRALYEAARRPKRMFELEGEIHEGAIMGLGVERVGMLREFVFGP